MANDAVAVVSLETNSYLDEDWHPLPPSHIAADLGVPCTVHPLGPRASGTHGLAEEFLVLDRDHLPRFAEGHSAAEPEPVPVPEPGPWLPERRIAPAPDSAGARLA
ncbi:hypothetical protein [Streptomyces sp. NBC_01264]|uniref:hypothetical protein n=1 Tax=Streptomyces sp. NBC_01264 TaxID=2903804 RepID=UPI00225A7BB6|nr:hypothetical protein [Streptomyces sp. NBC_01264]MCX4778059.1 hypothetical protein [Streptomyces sp. NBC_01264]